MILISSYFKERNSRRQEEYSCCIQKNINNKFIEKILLFTNDNSACNINNDKIEYVSTNSQSRPTVLDYFKYVKKNYADKILIMANLDIYFDDTISMVYKLDLNNVAVSLMRWNVKENGVVEIENSPSAAPGHIQDSWIFKLPDNFEKMDLNFSLGFMRSDSRLNFELSKAYKLINCPWDIKSYHYHTEKTVHNWTLNDMVGGQQAYVRPTKF